MARSRPKKTPALNVYISYSHHDIQPVNHIASVIKEYGYSVWLDRHEILPGDNIVEKIQDGLSKADVILFIVSENSLRSEWVQREFSIIALQQISKREQRIVPIRLDQSDVPAYLAGRQYIDLSQDFNQGVQTLLSALKTFTRESLNEKSDDHSIQKEYNDNHITLLKNDLRKGRLTLVCGAGVSVGAGIPLWNQLLGKLLESMMEIISKDHSLELGGKAATAFQKHNNASSLILGKYLKNNLGKDFATKVRDVLYSANPDTCTTIESIVTLARPQRDGRPLDSIITFNFDCLIEDRLTLNRIRNKAIFTETITHDPNELPIYHVHGYLPRTGSVPEDTELVFSEDAYHSQFIDPFSWSNLIQLNKLTQNTCLLIGISLTDPNMRRLLDVAWRKNPKRLSHYIVKRLPQSEDNAINKVSQLLEEQDANALGLNVIWINTFTEIDKLLEDIAL